MSPMPTPLLVRLSVALALLAWTQAPVRAQNDILAKATSYVVDLLPALTNVVAEETYVQRITSPNRKRELVSDYLLVRVEETGEWAAFRDVFSVDGKPVRDRDQRLARLFLQAPGNALDQAWKIANEGTRHNLTNIGTINNPLLAMAFLQPQYAKRFRFQSPRQDKAMGPDIWFFQYQEFVSPTILKGNANRDIPARGRIWVERDTGRIVKTELLLGADSARAGLSPIEIQVAFSYNEELKLSVPSEMKEWYPDRNGMVSGVATYGRFRRFGVTVEEAVK